MPGASQPGLVITPDQFRSHWQGHRALTRRAITAFPTDRLFTFSIGGMRPFSALATECLGMAVPTLHGIITREWKAFGSAEATSKNEILTTRSIIAVRDTSTCALSASSRHRSTSADQSSGHACHRSLNPGCEDGSHRMS